MSFSAGRKFQVALVGVDPKIICCGSAKGRLKSLFLQADDGYLSLKATVKKIQNSFVRT